MLEDAHGGCCRGGARLVALVVRLIYSKRYVVVAVVRVTRNYQVTIPAEVRRRLGIKVGDRVVVEGDKIVIRKASGGSPRIRLGLRLTPEEIDRLVEEGAARGSS